jgi:hypothetical protein
MICLHPYCPMGHGIPWNDVVNHTGIKIPIPKRAALLAALNALQPLGTTNPPLPVEGVSLKRLLSFCPCLFTQLESRVTPSAVVHLCEITLGARIVSSNAYDAFKIQHPNIHTHSFLHPPLLGGAAGGDIMERMCSEVLTNHGLPQLDLDNDGWPVWNRIGHVSLNLGKLREVKAFGDIMIPCAPSNLIISVKSEAAKERLLYSANMIEGIGFGFFKDANEFWSISRMKLFKRMGFTAIYMPDPTHATVTAHLTDKGTEEFAVNVNGTALYRPLSTFGDDMSGIAGKLSLIL